MPLPTTTTTTRNCLWYTSNGRLERFVEELSLESEGAITQEGREKVVNLINIVEKSKEAVEGFIAFGATFTARGGKMM